MKKLAAMFIAMLTIISFCFPVSAMAYDAPVSKFEGKSGGTIESHEVDRYMDDNGFVITEETIVYSYPATRATETKKTAVKNYIVSRSGQGDLLTITLDADFYYISGERDSVRCPRYYSSYTVHQPKLVKSYEETDMDYTTTSTSAKVKTKYKVVYIEDVLGGTKTVTPSLSITCSYLGVIS